MNEELFRKKSLDKIKSPENLDDYIRVSNPGIWLLLVSVIALLAGACIWGIFGHMESTADAVIRVTDGNAVCYVSDEDISSVRADMPVKADGVEACIAEIGEKSEQGYACSIEGFDNMEDGVYEGKIVISTIKPISFVLN